MKDKAITKNPTPQRESFTELLGQLANNSAAVVHGEIELAAGSREFARRYGLFAAESQQSRQER